jgi:HSP20 family molecular chaperone IbpA
MYTTKFRSLFPSILETNDMSDFSLDRLFESIADMGATTGSYRTERTESGWLLELALPGVTKEDVTITTEDSNLLIGIDSSSGWVKKSKKTFAIPQSADIESIFAEMKDGILSVKLSTKKEQKTKSIKIN